MLEVMVDVSCLRVGPQGAEEGPGGWHGKGEAVPGPCFQAESGPLNPGFSDEEAFSSCIVAGVRKRRATPLAGLPCRMATPAWIQRAQWSLLRGSLL